MRCGERRGGRGAVCGALDAVSGAVCGAVDAVSGAVCGAVDAVSGAVDAVRGAVDAARCARRTGSLEAVQGNKKSAVRKSLNSLICALLGSLCPTVGL